MIGAPHRLRILVLGYIVRGPLGGLAWHHLQYVLGLHRLGHEVYFLEDSDDYESCYDPSDNSVGCDPSYGLRFADGAFSRLGLGDRWGYFDSHRGEWHGPLAGRAIELARTADVLLNISGVNPLRDWFAHIPRRVLIDTDPAFTQIRHLTDEDAREAASRHTSFFTFGECFGRPGCTIPDDGFPWQPTRQPVVLDAWPVTPGPATGRLTTVMQWDSYAERDYAGKLYGMKSVSFQEYLDLPSQSGLEFLLAAGSESVPTAILQENGWQTEDPRVPTRDPWTYQEFIRDSKAEFGVAKHGYVVTRSGWFSERTCAYLASGRPAIVQDTGFSEFLPTGRGLLSFSNPEEALVALESLDAAYSSHCLAARDLVAECFDAARVLGNLLSEQNHRLPKARTLMISTEKFVFVHFPKTGGTFVTSVLNELGDLLSPQRVRVRGTLVTWFRSLPVKHATCSQLPKAERTKRLVSSVRNPYDLYVSEYEFGWWKRPAYPKYFRRLVPGFARKYPGYPDLTFEEFLRLYHEAFCVWPSSKKFRSEGGIGHSTQRFLWFYCRRPLQVLAKPWKTTMTAEQAKEELFDVHFLRTNRLNRDLWQFLMDQGYPEERLSFILELEKILPAGKGRSPDQKWEAYYTPELKQAVRRNDRLLFELFPEFDG